MSMKGNPLVVESDLSKANNRLAGDRKFEIAVDMHDLMRSKDTEEHKRFLLRPIGACVTCKGVVVDSDRDLMRDAMRYRYSCGRSKPHTVLKCDDGVTVYVNGAGKIEDSRAPTDGPLTNAQTWKDLMLNEFIESSYRGRSLSSFAKDYLTPNTSSARLTGARADYMIVDEMMMFDARMPPPAPAIKKRPKDLPATSEEGDAW